MCPGTEAAAGLWSVCPGCADPQEQGWMDKHWEYLMWNWPWGASSACNMQIFPTASQKMH